MATSPALDGSPTLEQIPPLEPGDRLTRAEFERRYDAMPHIKKAEFIEGVVYMPSPVRQRRHGRPHFRLIAWLGAYEAATPGIEGGDNATTRLDLENEPQPDAILFIEPERGGQAKISDEDYVELAPELVAEVSASTVSFDMHTKLEVYRRSGVREYLVWRVLDRQFDWFVLEDGVFKPLSPDADGLLKSRVFPGLWLDSAALVAGYMPRVFEALGRGIASAEHGTFVAQLGRNADGS